MVSTCTGRWSGHESLQSLGAVRPIIGLRAIRKDKHQCTAVHNLVVADWLGSLSKSSRSTHKKAKPHKISKLTESLSRPSTPHNGSGYTHTAGFFVMLWRNTHALPLPPSHQQTVKRAPDFDGVCSSESEILLLVLLACESWLAKQ